MLYSKDMTVVFYYSSEAVIRKIQYKNMGKHRSVPRIIIKHLLCALAVMNIPINDEHSWHIQFGEAMISSDSNIIEEAVPARIRLHGMMTRRPTTDNLGKNISQGKMEANCPL